MALRAKAVGGIVFFLGATGCGATDGQAPDEPIASTQEALVITVAGIGTASPLTGSTLPPSPGIPTAVAPRPTDFTIPVVNVLGLQTTAPPPDPIGDVGPNHYVQAVNGNIGVGDARMTIYDKAGVPVSAAATNLEIDTLVTDTGPCGTDPLGDPVVNYDQLADRWIILQITSSNTLCMYVSDTGDPAALDRWTLYPLDFDTMVDTAGNPVPGFFPDYPKLGVWPDAYYISTNDVSPNQMGAYAVERAAVLAGTPARFQRFVIPNLSIPVTFPYQPAGVVDLDGRRPPPPGRPGMFVRKVDDESLSPPGTTPTEDALEIWELHADFDTPANSTLTGPTSVVTEDFDVNICSLALFNNCADQPPGGVRLSVLGSLVGSLWRVQYRNFGTHETLVGTIEVDHDVEDPAPYWYEIRRSGGGAWSLFQEQTFAPDAPDTNDRWMGSIAMDGSGNIAFGYSISSPTLFPSINYIGRRAGDPLGTLTTPETTMAAGAAVQSDFSRWGDYSSMNVDPVDDCTFWYTSMYYEAAGSTRSTRVAAFGFPFPECVSPRAACVHATETLSIRDRAQVLPGTEPVAALINNGTSATEIGVDASVRDVLSIGNIALRDRARVEGVAQSAGTVTLGNGVVVTGGVTPGADLNLPAAPDLSGVTFPPPSGGNIVLFPSQTASRAPGSYGQVTLFSSAQLTLTAGQYFFANLQLEPGSRIIVDESAGPVVILVQSSLVFRGTITTPLGAVATVFLGYTGTSPVVLETAFNGAFVAPNASVSLGAGTSLSFRGQFVARNFELRPAVILTCDSSAMADFVGPAGGAAGATCTDGIPNGAETDVDCGGGTCPDCANGRACSVDGDCQSNNCVAGVCQPVGASVAATLEITSNWDGGYCATLRVTNNGTTPTTGWTVVLDTNQASRYTSWNGNFSGNSGVINVTPSFFWNQAIAPGATDTSVGFCANRNVPGSGTLPFVISSSGTF